MPGVFDLLYVCISCRVMRNTSLSQVLTCHASQQTTFSSSSQQTLSGNGRNADDVMHRGGQNPQPLQATREIRTTYCREKCANVVCVWLRDCQVEVMCVVT